MELLQQQDVELDKLKEQEAGASESKEAEPQGKFVLPPEDPSVKERVHKFAIRFIHDESIFHSTDGQKYWWCEPGSNVLLTKSKGAGLMVSGYIGMHDGWLRYNDRYCMCLLSPRFR